jgi:phosphoglycolate phosphatase-like HAD superfamily hydrolase
VGGNAVHHAAIVGGLETVYGLDLDGFRFLTLEPWGKTDLQIALDCLRAHEVDEEVQAALLEEWTARAQSLHAELAGDGEAPLAAPQAHAALEALRARGGLLGLVTGNLREIALRKLEIAGLGPLFRGAPGGFGSDHRERAELVRLARVRAGGAGPPWPAERTVIIGDTPRDIACARADGVACVAVTTGPFDAAALSAADAVVAGLGELEAVLVELGLSPGPR